MTFQNTDRKVPATATARSAVILLTLWPTMSYGIEILGAGSLNGRDGETLLISMEVNQNDDGLIHGNIGYVQTSSIISGSISAGAAPACTWVSGDALRALAAGPAAVTLPIAGDTLSTEWMVAAINISDPDAITVMFEFYPEQEARDVCEAGPPYFSHTLDEGSFQISAGQLDDAQVGSEPASDETGDSAATQPAPGAAPAGDLVFPFDGSTAPGELVTEPGSAMPAFVAGVFGQAIEFSDDAAVIFEKQVDPAQTKGYSITAWIKRQSGRNSGWILNTGDVERLPSLSLYNSKLQARAGRENFESDAGPGEIPADEWTFVAGIWDFSTGTVRLHVGDWQKPFKAQRMDPSSDLLPQKERIGPSGSPGYFITVGADNHEKLRRPAVGVALDDVRLWDRALTPEEIDSVREGDRIAATAPPDDPTTAADLGFGQTVEDPTGIPSVPEGLDRDKYPEEESDESPATGDSDDSSISPLGSGSSLFSYSDFIVEATGVSGDEGDFQNKTIFVDAQQFLTGMLIMEENDKPCLVALFSEPISSNTSALPSSTSGFSVCDGGLTRIGVGDLANWTIDLSYPDRSEPARVITGIQVCTNFLNKRVKGVRAEYRRIPRDANYDGNVRTAVLVERTNCTDWHDFVRCSTNQYAVGATLYFKDGSLASPKDFLSGIELHCSIVYPPGEIE